MADAALGFSSVGCVAVAVREDPVVPPDLEPFRRELTGYCYRMLGSGFEAEDAAQEVILRAWRSADGFEGRSSLRRREPSSPAASWRQVPADAPWRAPATFALVRRTP